MSTESMLAFYGVRFEIGDEEINALEERTHHLLLKARENGLKVYWGDFAAQGSKFLLFIGDSFGVLGFENECEIHITPDEFDSRVKETDARLQGAGLLERPMLHLVWQPDK